MKIQTAIADNSISTMGDNHVVEHTMAKDSVNLQMLMLRTGLYSNKINAVVREYLTNARDAHVEAGHNIPIEVTIPNRFGNDLVIRDYGPGMSPEFIKSVYVQYTASTKRDTNKLTGGWGIGSKSAYSYADSFTVVSIHDGVAYTWLAESFEDGSGRFTLALQQPSTEPSGVAIKISLAKTEDSNSFLNAVEFYSKFIDVPVKVNGFLQQGAFGDEEFHCSKTSNAKFSLRKNISSSRYDKKLFLVQGGVPYGVSLSDIHFDSSSSTLVSYLTSYSSECNLCIEVPLGTFMPDISREKIQFDAAGKTLTTIKELVKEADNYFNDLWKKIFQSSGMSNYQLQKIYFDRHQSFLQEYIRENIDSSMPDNAVSYLAARSRNYIGKMSRLASSPDCHLNKVFSDYVSDIRGVAYCRYKTKVSTYETQKSVIDKAICHNVKGLSIYVSYTSYKRNERLHKVIDTSRSNYYFQIPKEVAFEDFVNSFKNAINDPSCNLNGLDASLLNFHFLEKASNVRKSTGRRATKFLTVSEISYGMRLSLTPIKSEDVDTDKIVVYGIVYRNEFVNENCQTLSISHSLISKLIRSDKFELRAIKLSEFKKNKELKRNKIDFSSLVSLESLASCAGQYNEYLTNRHYYDKSCAALSDSSSGKKVLDVYKVSESDIESLCPSSLIKDLGITKETLDSICNASIVMPDTKRFAVNNVIGDQFPRWSQFKSFIGNYTYWYKNDDDMLLLAFKEMPHLFES